MKKYITIIVSLILISVAIHTANAVDYTLLEPIGNLPAGQSASFSNYLQQMFIFLVQIGIGASVIMLVFAGVEYTASGASESAKKDATDRIWNTVVGLIVALAAYLILNVINPDLVNFRLKIPPVKQPSAVAAAGTGTTPIDNSPITPGKTGSVAENTQRETLAKNGVAINANKKACPPNTPYQSVSGGCISTDRMQSYVVDGLGYLKKEIPGAGNFILTGGSEDGHSANGVTNQGGHSAGVAVDIAMNQAVTDFVTNNGARGPARTTTKGYPIYVLNEGSFINESNHWHWEPNPTWVKQQAGKSS